MKRTIIFGDIHGCHNEWQKLLDKLKVNAADRIISVGDLIFKGPDSAAVLDLAMSLPNLQCVMGNHEYAFLKAFSHGRPQNLNERHEQAILEMGPRLEVYLDYIRTWPFYLDLPECIVVHAGIRPGAPLAEQNPLDLTHLRTLEPEGIAWHDRYMGKKLIVYGHWAKQGLKIKSNSIGLDSGCVYGKKLSALVLPTREIVTVDAAKVYCPIKTPKKD